MGPSLGYAGKYVRIPTYVYMQSGIRPFHLVIPLATCSLRSQRYAVVDYGRANTSFPVSRADRERERLIVTRKGGRSFPARSRYKPSSTNLRPPSGCTATAAVPLFLAFTRLNSTPSLHFAGNRRCLYGQLWDTLCDSVHEDDSFGIRIDRDTMHRWRSVCPLALRSTVTRGAYH